MLRGSPATGAGTTSGAISYGSAASGATFRPVANGCPGIGANPRKAPSGPLGIGQTPRRPRCNTWPSRLRPPKRVRTLLRLRRTTLGCPVVGCGRMVAMLGAPVTGRPSSRTGFGFPPITYGLRAATSSSTATGITLSAVAACCMRPCILLQTCMVGGGSRIRRRP